MSDEELIEKARQEASIHDKLGDGFSKGSEERAFYYGHRDRYKRLADALAKATTAHQPREATSDDDREAAFESGMESVDWDMVRDGVGDPQEAAGSAVRAALEACAAAPDAATEELERIKPLFENLSREYPNECNKRVKAEAERDAALAAVDRVRAVLAEERAWLEHLVESGDACPRVVIGIGKVEAALDGAPEPEWEWGYRCETLNDVHTRKSRESAEGAVKDLTEYWALHGKKFELVRRRKAGPWIPVEGEKP